MNDAPEFIDNRDGNTMAEVLGRVPRGAVLGFPQEVPRSDTMRPGR